MKFRLSKPDVLLLKDLFETSAWNIDYSEFLNEELLNGEEQFRGPLFDFLKSIKTKEKLTSELSGYEEEGIDGHLSTIEELNPETYSSSWFYKAMGEACYASGKFTLGMGEIKPYSPILLRETYAIPLDGYIEHNDLGFFDVSFPIPELQEDGVTWMSLNPHEIETMKEPLGKAHGHILVHGLGLAYFAAMAAEKEEVTAVDVVEKDPDVIKIYHKAIEPLIPHAEKINVIEGDSLKFEEKVPYDFRFVDIYRNEEDGVPLYLAMLRKEKGETHYWIEKSLLCYIRRIILELMLEEAEGMDVEGEEGEIGALFSAFKKALNQKEFASFAEISSFLEDRNLREFLRSVR